MVTTHMVTILTMVMLKYKSGHGHFHWILFEGLFLWLFAWVLPQDLRLYMEVGVGQLGFAISVRLAGKLAHLNLLCDAHI